jgi:hypothetical protein
MVVELAANPDDRTGLGGEHRFFAVALAILSRLEQAPFFGKERMLLDIRNAYVATFTGGFHHQVERIAAGFNGAHDCLAGGLSQSCLSVRLAFHDAPYSRRFIRWWSRTDALMRATRLAPPDAPARAPGRTDPQSIAFREPRVRRGIP